MKCVRCKAVNAGGVLFCRNCGNLFKHDSAVDCENHSGRNSVGICVVCGKPVCGECVRASEGRCFCEVVPHAQVPGTHAKFAAVSEFGAELVAKNLAANGIEALVFSQHHYSHFHRFTDDAPASVFVKNEEAKTARALIKEMDLSDFLH